MNMSYPESVIKVAVHYGNGEVKIYGPEHQGFRPFIVSRQFNNNAEGAYFAMTNNDDQRRAFGLIP